MATKTTPKTATKAKNKNKAKATKAEPAEFTQPDGTLEFEDVEGAHLLKPIEQLTAAEQMRLMHRFQTLAVGDIALNEDEDDQIRPETTANMDLGACADLTEYIANYYAISRAEFNKFVKGKGGMTRAIVLTMAYVTELGKGMQ